MKTMRLMFGFVVVSFFAWLSAPANADLESTNYKVADSFFSGGSGDLDSSSYAIDEGLIDHITKDLGTSTNYKVEGTIGILGRSNLVAVTNVTPAEYTRFFTDESPSFTVTAVDPDSDTLQYQAKQDGTLKDGPQSSNVLTWSLSASDKGRHNVTLEVLDPDGTVVASRQTYVYRRPVS